MTPRLRSLHYVRGLAMALVVAAHVQSMWKALSPGDNRFHHALLVFLHEGAIGVFFVLAGFLFHHHHMQQQGRMRTDDASSSSSSGSEAVALTSAENIPQAMALKEKSNLPICITRRRSRPNQVAQSFAQSDTLRFIKHRICKIGLPYVLMSTPILLRRIFLEERRIVRNEIDHESTFEYRDAKSASVWRRTVSLENLQLFVSQLCSGRDVIYAYWFIPVLLGLTLLSPLVMMFLRCSTTTQMCLLFFSYAFALVVVGRPNGETKPDTLQMIIYFWPVYLNGTVFSVHRKKIFGRRGEWIVLGLLFVVLFGQIEFGSQVPGHIPLVANTLGLLQLLLTCWWSLAVAQRYNTRCFRPQILHHVVQRLADASLEIYLLHPWVLVFMDYSLKDRNIKQRLQRQGCCVWVLETCVVLLVCFGLSLAGRWVIGQCRLRW